MNLAIRGTNVGYLPGAGDSVAQCLEQMGYKVRQLDANDLTEDGLRGLDAFVIGVRAFNVRTDLAAHLPAIFAFCQAGGNVILQYNRPERREDGKNDPLRFGNLGRPSDRRTIAHHFLGTDHPASTFPTRLLARTLKAGCRNAESIFPTNGTTISRRSLLATIPAKHH